MKINTKYSITGIPKILTYPWHACVCCASHIPYDGMVLNCLLPLQYTKFLCEEPTHSSLRRIRTLLLLALILALESHHGHILDLFSKKKKKWEQLLRRPNLGKLKLRERRTRGPRVFSGIL